MECMEWMQLQKKKQGQTNFFEIHLTLLHVFYVLFHSDAWMGLSETRTKNYSNSIFTIVSLNKNKLNPEFYIIIFYIVSKICII